MQLSDTIAAIATPPGEGGIAIVRVSGPGALAVAAGLFRPARGGDPAAFPGYSVHYGRFVEGTSGEDVDDGLLTVFRAPHSYTGEESVELSCHGGAATTERLLRCVLRGGARLAEPGEFTQRAFLNGRLDLAQAEAVADLIRARTETAQRMARRKLDGALSGAVRRLRQELIGILAAIEVTIDFSDEVGDLDYPPLQARIAAVRREVEALAATADRGRILREGLRVALIGRPNVGKSSLFNALLRVNRAIVAALPGTTRDRLEESRKHRRRAGGVDRRGGPARDRRRGRARRRRATESALQQADLILFVLDASVGITPDNRAVADRLRVLPLERIVVVLNKRDAAPEPALAGMRESADEMLNVAEVVAVSALTGDGLPDLERALLQLTLGRDGRSLSENSGPDAALRMCAINAPQPPILGESEHLAPTSPPGIGGGGGVVAHTQSLPGRPGIGAESVVVSSVRHREALESALASLREAERTAEQRLPGDFIAIDARGALDALGRITGETVTDNIIHRIFQDFCVGK